MPKYLRLMTQRSPRMSRRKRRPMKAKKADSDEKKPEEVDEKKTEESKENKPEDERSEQKTEAIDVDVVDSKPAPPADATKTADLVLILNSGRFKTIETRYIINQALSPLS